MLKDRNVECKGCSEKADFVEKAFETQQLPIKVSKQPPVVEAASENGNEQEKMSKKDIDDVKLYKFSIFFFAYNFIYST
jgi:hypothetical protein